MDGCFYVLFKRRCKGTRNILTVQIIINICYKNNNNSIFFSYFYIIIVFMEELRGRIKLILSEKRLSVMALAGGRGTLQVVLNNQINGTTAISANTILVVLSTFPDVSAEWLMRGTGSMLGHADIVVDNHNSHHNNMNTGNGVQNIGDAAAVIAEKDKMIAELKSDKDMLMRMLTNLTSK